MNNHDDYDIKAAVREALEEENRSDYIYLKNKDYIINAMSDDEKIEKIFNERELYYPQDLSFIFREIKSIEEQQEESKTKQETKTTIENAKYLLEKNLDKLVYDEIKYDEFYKNYLNLIKENASRYLVTKRQLEKIEYILNKDEIQEVLEKNKYKLELIFDENNNGYVCIVKK